MFSWSKLHTQSCKTMDGFHFLYIYSNYVAENLNSFFVILIGLPLIYTVIDWMIEYTNISLPHAYLNHILSYSF